MSKFGWSLPPECGTLPGEEFGALELEVSGVWYAWDEDGNVYQHDPDNKQARDDGYVRIGHLDAPDVEHDPAALLRRYVEVRNALKVFRRGDGAHRGLTDWHDRNEAALRLALEAHLPFDTGWYASKHEIASARIYSEDGKTVHVETSVSDDLDTEGHGRGEAADWTLEAVAAAIDKAWDEALEDRKGNEPYVGFSIHDKRGDWIETYLQSNGEFDVPPGDNYNWWGWQHDEEDGVGIPNPRIPAEAVAAFEAYVEDLERPESLTVAGWTIKPWS